MAFHLGKKEMTAKENTAIKEGGIDMDDASANI